MDYQKTILNQIKFQRNRGGLKGLNLALIIGFIYVFMEWLFQITKISFMDPLNFREKLSSLLLAFSIISIIILLLVLLSFLLEILLGRFSSVLKTHVYYLPAALLMSCLILILIDNFTYTLFLVGIIFSEDIDRLAYLVLFLAIFVISLLKLSQTDHAFLSKNYIPLGSAVLLISSILMVLFSISSKGELNSQDFNSSKLIETPNIIFLSSDMLDASNMSVYGYERDTTPFLRELASTSLVGMNAFTNATKSIAGETSVLTGKLPSTTRVLANPDYLRGEDKYQHLPGILKDRGYKTISLGVPFYVDANLIQFQDAFDDVNCTKKQNGQLSLGFAKLDVTDEYIFFDSLFSRITERLLHIFFIEEIDYPFLEVTDWKYYPVGDEERLNCLYSYLEETKTTGIPLFAHIHQMSTHGQGYVLSEQVFSKGLVQTEEFQTEFYDDSLLAFDSVVQELVEYLKDNQMYDNTILVIYTDHPQLYKTAVRTPLIIHFPRGQFSGSININTQTIDIPPTILDYLNIQQPSWMEGGSLLGELEPDRLIFSFDSLLFSFVRNGIWQVVDEAREPPFYQFAKVTVIQGSTFHNFMLQTNESSIGEVEGYVESDIEINLYTHEEIRKKTRELLLNADFEIPNDW